MYNPEFHALVSEMKATLDRVASAVAHDSQPDAEDFAILRGGTEQIIEIASKTQQA